MLQRNSSSISPSFLYHSILSFTQLQGPKVEEDRDKDSVMPQVICFFALFFAETGASALGVARRSSAFSCWSFGSICSI